MYRNLQHPEIDWILRTGYPSWMQEGDEPEYDEDAEYDEQREAELEWQ